MERKGSIKDSYVKSSGSMTLQLTFFVSTQMKIAEECGRKSDFFYTSLKYSSNNLFNLKAANANTCIPIFTPFSNFSCVSYPFHRFLKPLSVFLSVVFGYFNSRGELEKLHDIAISFPFAKCVGIASSGIPLPRTHIYGPQIPECR